MLNDLYSTHNDIAVPSFILSGAPPKHRKLLRLLVPLRPVRQSAILPVATEKATLALGSTDRSDFAEHIAARPHGDCIIFVDVRRSPARTQETAEQRHDKTAARASAAMVAPQA